MASIPWTHAMESDGRIYGFTMDGTCPKCRREVSAPNVVTLCDARARLESMGVTFVDKMPSEIVVTNGGEEMCQRCYADTPGAVRERGAR